MGANGNTRIYGMDALRAICMMLGIVLHATIAYKIVPLPNWTYDNSFHHAIFDIGYHIIHAFRMPLFFLVAGFFARLVIKKNGWKVFVQHRFKRIVIPFIGSCFFILPFTILPFNWFAASQNHALSNEAIWGIASKGLLRWNGLAHLWFLYYLILFYVLLLLGLLLFRLPVLHWIQCVLTRMFFKPLPIIVFSFCLLATIGYNLPSSGVIVDTSVFPDLFIFGYYFFWFAVGYVINKAPAALKFCSQRYLQLLLIGFVCTFFVIGNQSIFGTVVSGTMLHTLLKVVETVCLVFGFCGFFLVLFQKPNTFIQYLSDASYWMYLIHLGIVAALHIILTYTNVPGYFRFFIVVGLTLLVTLGSYHFLVRYSWLGRMLHGPRQKVPQNKSL
jgi:glucan biosynthesis protein C